MTKQEIIDLIRDSGFCTLCTIEDNQPKGRPMMPYLTEDGKLIVALLSRSRTIPQVKKNPWVELCYVDRKMWYCRISGKGVISENKAYKQILWNNVPYLKQYFGSVEDPNFILMEIEIKNVEAMTPHQKEPEMINILD